MRAYGQIVRASTYLSDFALSGTYWIIAQ